MTYPHDPYLDTVPRRSEICLTDILHPTPGTLWRSRAERCGHMLSLGIGNASLNTLPPRWIGVRLSPFTIHNQAVTLIIFIQSLTSYAIRPPSTLRLMLRMITVSVEVNVCMTSIFTLIDRCHDDDFYTRSYSDRCIESFALMFERFVWSLSSIRSLTHVSSCVVRIV